MKLLWILVMAAACSACSVLPPEPLAHSNGFAPVFPVEQKLPPLATGARFEEPSTASSAASARKRQVSVEDLRQQSSKYLNARCQLRLRSTMTLTAKVQ